MFDWMLLFNFSVEENVCERDGTCFAGKSANIVKTLKYLAITDITQKLKTKLKTLIGVLLTLTLVILFCLTTLKNLKNRTGDEKK